MERRAQVNPIRLRVCDRGARECDRGPSGTSAAIRTVRRRLLALADSDATVLITGETGTGKGVVARALHRSSRRREQPFVHVDCAALTPSVIESELFGHERGAFTGAVERRRGRFEQAAEGTVFLDEVAELAPPLQAKLLRVLQDREYERVGGTQSLRMRARVVAATSRDLATSVREGRFRADLFYRLAVIELRMPPLRERLEDLPVLVAEAVARISLRAGISPPPIAPDLVPALRRHDWPGNVRELFNCVERLMVENRGAPLTAAALAALDPSPFGLGSIIAGGPPAATRLEPVPGPEAGERERIAATLRATGGNVARAARRLGLPRSTLRHRILRLGLSDLIPRD